MEGRKLRRESVHFLASSRRQLLHLGVLFFGVLYLNDVLLDASVRIPCDRDEPQLFVSLDAFGDANDPVCHDDMRFLGCLSFAQFLHITTA